MWLSYVCLPLVCSFAIYAETVTHGNLSSIYQYIDKHHTDNAKTDKKRTLYIFFDIDNTLLTKQPCSERAEKTYSLEDKDIERSYLVEEDTAAIVDSLRQDNVYLYGLTSRPFYSRKKVMYDISNWRYPGILSWQQLAKQGIVFDEYFAQDEKSRSVIEKMYYKGIFYSVGDAIGEIFPEEMFYVKKGVVLEYLFKERQQEDIAILFVDDRLDEVASVDDAMRKLNIPCTSFYYTHVSDCLSRK